MANIRSLEVLPRLLSAVASQTARLFNLTDLAAAVGDRFAGGVVLYDGELSARFGDRLHAVPVRRLWEPA